jgi:hypothetical protein
MSRLDAAAAAADAKMRAAGPASNAAAAEEQKARAAHMGALDALAAAAEQAMDAAQTREAAAKALGVDAVDDSADGRMVGRADDGSGSYATVLKHGGPSEAAGDAIEAALDAAVAASEAVVATADAMHAARDGAPIGGFTSGMTFFIARQEDDAKGALVKSIRAHGGEVVSLYDAARVTHVVVEPPRFPLATQVAAAARDQPEDGGHVAVGADGTPRAPRAAALALPGRGQHRQRRRCQTPPYRCGHGDNHRGHRHRLHCHPNSGEHPSHPPECRAGGMARVEDAARREDVRGERLPRGGDAHGRRVDGQEGGEVRGRHGISQGDGVVDAGRVGPKRSVETAVTSPTNINVAIDVHTPDLPQ